jgi:hypothetical protein
MSLLGQFNGSRVVQQSSSSGLSVGSFTMLFSNGEFPALKAKVAESTYAKLNSPDLGPSLFDLPRRINNPPAGGKRILAKTSPGVSVLLRTPPRLRVPQRALTSLERHETSGFTHCPECVAGALIY